MTRLNLGDLVDLEARLLEEQADPEEVRRARYRQLGRRLAETQPLPDDSGALLKALLRLDPRPDSLGRRFATALKLLQFGLVSLGLLVGGGLALGVFQNTDRHPVNLLTVLVVLVGAQLALLALLLLAILPTGDNRASGPVQHLLLGALHWILRRLGVADRLLALQDRLDAHRGLLKWTLLRATQIFGVAFNIGVLAFAYYRFASTDIDFGWSTTLRIEPETVQRWAKVVAAPWSWIKPSEMEPSLDLVVATQYSHLQGQYLHPREPFPPLFAWYGFVMFAIFTYGFVPRLVFLMIASLRVRYSLADTPRKNVGLACLCDWMREPVVNARPEGPEPAAHRVAAAPVGAEPPLPPPGSSVELLDGAPPEAAQILSSRYGWKLDPGSTLPRVAVISAWEEPTKGQLRRFSMLRNRLLIVVLYDPSGKDDVRRAKIFERWKRDLPKAMDGTPVRVEAL
jgi:hypothetical protein